MLRRLLAIFLPAALLTGAVVLALYLQDRAAEKSLHEQAGIHLVDLHADIITRELEEVKSELLYLSGQVALQRYLAGAPMARKDLEGEYLRFCQYRGVYDQVRYLDDKGRECVRVNFDDGRPAVVPESELQAKDDRYYFNEARRLGRGEVFVSAFDLNVEHGVIERPLKPTLRFATPIFEGDVKRGVLVLNYLGAALLRKLSEVSHSFRGTPLLLNSDGFYLRGPTPEVEWGFILDHGRRFDADHPQAWGQIRSSEKRQFSTAEGLFTYRRVDGGLIVVALTPPALLEERSAATLLRLLLLYAAVLAVLLPLVWYLAYVGALRRAREQQLKESEARLRTLSAQLITTQEEERRGISRDLHDELGQVVTSVTLDLQRAGHAADPAKKDELIGRALRGAGCLLDRIHEISTRVRPPILDDLGLKDAVQSLLSDYEQRTGIVPKAELSLASQDVPAAVSENVYRILQEALTNVSRHAQTKEVLVSLHAGADRLALTVRDAGVGFDPAARADRRLGILGMRERAELLGGTCVVTAEPGKGTRVEVVIPIVQPQAA